MEYINKTTTYKEICEYVNDEIKSYEQDLVVSGIQYLLGGEVISGIVGVLNKALKLTPSDMLQSDEVATSFKNALKSSGFGFVDDSLLQVICNGYVKFVINGVLTDMGFECLTRSVYENIKEERKTREEAELITDNQLYEKVYM